MEYRARLAREMERQESSVRGSPVPDKMRILPVREEHMLSPTSADLPTTSTESNKTVRGGVTPGFVAGTPSYPFPRMSTPAFRPSRLQQALGQQAQPAGFAAPSAPFMLHDQLRSDPSTPASAMTFLPPGATPYSESPDFPTPNLYSLSLMLSAEPGLDAWWNNVIQIMTEFYRVERASLAVPADTTDIDNVPWGQKATYNAQEHDEMSMGYMARNNSIVTNSADDLSELSSNIDVHPKGERPPRPGIQSRHSFTAYEEKKESTRVQNDETSNPEPPRPALASRSKSYYPGTDRREPAPSQTALNQQALRQHDANEQPDIPNWDPTIEPQNQAQGRVLPVLQGLDLEADPLIDHNGITKVIERGKVIALTRSYPYLDQNSEDVHSANKLSKSAPPHDSKLSRKPTKSESVTKLSALLANASTTRNKNSGNNPLRPDKAKYPNLLATIDDTPPRPPTPKYEEYEQAPPSPWSQSPAPSPAVRADPSENPFFTDATVDEESFNPGPSPHDYTSSQPPETIGVDNSWTVLHIPLYHPLLSKSAPKFRLNSTVLQQKTTPRSKTGVTTPEQPPIPNYSTKDRSPPIAVLSILSSVIPYPSNLRHSLEQLAPHLATSFSMCRHYSNLEMEVMGLHRKRPSTAGFGAVGPDGRPVVNPAFLANLNYAPADDPGPRSITGSLTSPSDYSAQSRSYTASPMGTPLWDPGSFGLVLDRRATGNSPGHAGGDSYFSTKSKGGNATEASPATSRERAARTGKDSLSAANRQHQRSSSLRFSRQESSVSRKEAENQDVAHRSGPSEPEPPREVSDLKSGTVDLQKPQDVDDNRHRLVGPAGFKHTRLHSYGGDFATTLQSLPPSSPLVTRPTTTHSSSQSRPGSAPSTQLALLPPTDRLKGLMLDLLPVHVFVAWPVTGEIVWVNSRYLAYRGQTIADLVADPWSSLHADDREDFLRTWSHSLRTGDTFSQTVRLRRFDGAYRWHQAHAVASRDKRGMIVQFIGSYMDIHDQKVAEHMALRQQEIEASEAKHRLLANLIPQIIFTATESDGITFANEQWLSYTGQSDEAALGLGFMDFVHPDDLAKCRLPAKRPPGKNGSDTTSEQSSSTIRRESVGGETSSETPSVSSPRPPSERMSESTLSADADTLNSELSELVRKGVIKVGTDSNGRLSYTTEMRLRSRAGDYRWHLIRCVEIDGAGFGSGASSYFGSATDINDHKLLEAKLKEAMESKSRFLSNMSHEIRTPLIGISGMVSFLQDTTLNEEQRDYTNTIQTSSTSLLMIINDILDLSKVDAGMMKLKFEWFHTRSLIEDVNELVSTMAIAKRLELNYIVEEDVPTWVKGDKVRIRQVLLNVIGNAIKFTAEGEVFSRCRVFSNKGTDPSLDDHELMLEYSVVDTGRGFTKQEAELIFKPFSQIDGSSTRQHGGSGLGLVISRQLVELHGGRMEGTAEPGKGSKFTFTAKFGLPTREDHPNVTTTPPSMTPLQPSADEKPVPSFKPYLLPRKAEQPPAASPSSDPGIMSPALTSSASSDPSVRSTRSQTTTRSSVSSVNVGLVHFSEAAKASGQDLSQMKLEMPPAKLSPQIVPTRDGPKLAGDPEQFRPPMYSILIICPQLYSREATTKHIETTLPKDVPHQITSLRTAREADKLIGGEESVTFTHVVLNLGSAEEIIRVLDKIMATSGGKTTVLVLSDSVQRQAVLKLANPAHQRLLNERKMIFVYKPVKPSRFAAIFDPARERDLSIDFNRTNAAQMVENQKQNYLDVEKRIGNKGYKVLLVEDNTVNQKVLVRYLDKVGIKADIAADGVEATEMVFSHPPKYYSLILCDLHMPRKDGYQTCQDIREWEKNNAPQPIPIIALSANVMSDVQEKCVTAGFNDYVTKPVDFADLSKAMSKYF
ncbi:hypothetical protein F4780DRAFT_768119 [Xylariomycetidae sp. FL0641]|nr:hypothetical protein F4780DRAFT_768119 [Xylariomycetidae sp. FL0641]